MAKKKLTIKKIKSPKIAKFKTTKPVKATIKIKNTAGKQTKEIKVGGKLFHSSTSTTGLVSKYRAFKPVTNKQSTTEPKSKKVYY